MQLRQLLIGVRATLGDLQNVKYSTHELLTAINESITIVNQSLTELDSHIVKKEIDIDSNETALPDNFNAIVSLENSKGEALSYKIVGDVLKVNAPAKLVYLSSFPYYEDIEDDVPLPQMYADIIKLSAAVFIDKKNQIEFRNMIRDEVQRISIGREFHTYNLNMPFNL